MTDITPEELEELKALETWLRMDAREIAITTPLLGDHPAAIRQTKWADALNALIRSAEELGRVRERIAGWMILHSVATGHGDTIEDLLDELDVELSQLRARLAKAERVVEAARDARKLARPWIDKCIGAPSMTMDEWLKVDDDLQNALSVYSKET